MKITKSTTVGELLNKYHTIEKVQKAVTEYYSKDVTCTYHQ